jgi:hypothetical protein
MQDTFESEIIFCNEATEKIKMNRIESIFKFVFLTLVAFKKLFTEFSLNFLYYFMESEELPIFKYEHEILNSVKEYDYSFIVGLPGSGKSTQVPKFLLPHGKDPQVMIAMTQPKKLAVYNIYSTLSQDLGENLIG